MSSDGSVTRWLGPLKAGDPVAARHLWERYFRRLVVLARAKLKGGPRRAADEEDVALSAFDSFYRGVQEGRFPRLLDRDDLWQLLVVLTARKAANLVRDHRRDKRGGGQVRGDSALQPGDGGSGAAGFDAVTDGEPTPEEAAILAEEVERLLGRLRDARLRQAAVWKLEGYSNAEIAARQCCSEPTVERRFAVIRRLFKET